MHILCPDPERRKPAASSQNVLVKEPILRCVNSKRSVVRGEENEKRSESNEMKISNVVKGARHKVIDGFFFERQASNNMRCAEALHTSVTLEDSDRVRYKSQSCALAARSNVGS